MKKRRTTLIALTLTAALCLGIGYAAVTTTLDVTGKADVNADEVFANAIDFTAARAQDAVNDTASVNVNDAFYGCTSLASVSFAEGCKLELISSKAFMNCSALASISIPANVTKIGDGAFSNCEKLH